MAATVTVPYMESAQLVMDDPPGDFPILLRMVFRARLLADGSIADIIVEMPLTSPDPLDQTAWDTIWDGVLAKYASTYANSPTTPPTNPIVV